MSTQVQMRGASTATQEARTLASRVVDIDTTLGRLNIHDGTTAGGVPHVRATDHLNQVFTHGSVSGTNALAVTLAKAPAAYAVGQKVSFFAAADNTASATININSLGAITIKKIASGGLADLVAGDILANGYYEATYDGTYFVLISTASGSGTHGKQLIFSSTTFTVPAGVTTVYISGSGGGGGGGGKGGSGGAGGTTSFGSLVSLAGGGGGGNAGTVSNGGEAGGSAGFIFLINDNTDGVRAVSGRGGGALAGRSIVTASGSITGQAAITNSGDGGSGYASIAYLSNLAAGGGGHGTKLLPTAYTVIASSSHTVTIGAAGAAGSGGSSGSSHAGGAGGAGWLLVEW